MTKLNQLAAIATIIGAIIAAIVFISDIGQWWGVEETICQIQTSGLSVAKTNINIEEKIDVSIRANNPEGRAITFNWQAVNGEMNPSLRSPSASSTYTAPSFEVDDTISVEVTMVDCEPIKHSIQVSVVNIEEQTIIPTELTETSVLPIDTPTIVSDAPILPSVTPSITTEKVTVFPTYPACLLIGEWEAQLDNNKFRMLIEWDETEQTFKGTITKLGVESKGTGFVVGEVTYKAKLTDKPNILNEQGKWRTSSTAFEWRSYILDINSWPSNDEATLYDDITFIRMNGSVLSTCQP